MSNPVQQYQDAVTKAEELKAKAIHFLRTREAEIESELAQVEKEIAAMNGEAKPKAERVKGPKYTGKQISFRLLSEMLKERPDRTLNLRKEEYDTKWMKKLVGAWPTVVLVG